MPVPLKFLRGAGGVATEIFLHSITSKNKG